MAKILVVNGPNLNLIGSREPKYYGQVPLDEVRKRVTGLAQDNGHELLWYQSNAEHELVDRIHNAQQENVAFVVINPAAFTHTSIALRDALLATAIPFIEVHLSNIYAREKFRHRSYFADVALGQISGLGGKGYELAVLAAVDHLTNAKT